MHRPGKAERIYVDDSLERRKVVVVNEAGLGINASIEDEAIDTAVDRCKGSSDAGGIGNVHGECVASEVSGEIIGGAATGDRDLGAARRKMLGDRESDASRSTNHHAAEASYAKQRRRCFVFPHRLRKVAVDFWPVKCHCRQIIGWLWSVLMNSV